MNKTLSVYKPVGMTPFECVRLIKQQFPEYQNQKIAYAGRLDPMAEGLLLLLIGDECKNRTHYQLMPKTYICQMLLGITSDTYDTLGQVSAVTHLQIPSERTIESVLKKYIGSFDQPYPPYSSVRVNGKPLFYWARKNQLDNITIPKKTVTIHDITLQNIETYTFDEIIKKIIEKINSVHGDFRQKEIIKSWQQIEKNPQQITLVEFNVECSSGTYIRSLVHTIGEKLGTGALVFSLKRTTVGPFQLHDAVQLNSLT